MIKTNVENIENELLDIVKIFYPKNFEKIVINHTFGGECGQFNRFNICGTEYYAKHRNAKYYAKSNNSRVLKRIIKSDLYKILSRITKTKSTWGSLTGIRPVKLYRDMVSEFKGNADKVFLDFFDISKVKLNIIKNIAKVQQRAPTASIEELDLYIGIPFCNGKCNYCSFVSADINKSKDLIEPYIAALVKEITALKELVALKQLKVRAIYIGGGTPSSFSVKNLKIILESLSGFGAIEYTFEAGRPDSINKELLDLLTEYGVNRISINPQTANDATLTLIGRNHTFKDVSTAYELAKKYNFIINMDLIAGLPGENLKDFKNSLNKVLKFNPDNITIHTLCLKKGSLTKIDLEKKKQNDRNLNSTLETVISENTENTKSASEIYKSQKNTEDLSAEKQVFKILKFAYKTLKKNQFEPYYLYRQKYSIGNHENIGFYRNGKACLYNIDNMDDTVTVLACGANAISKCVYEGGRIERCANPKDIKTYIKKIDEINLMKID